MARIRTTVPVCPSGELKDKTHIIKEVQYRGKPHSAIVFRFRGQAYAYLNQCVHMPRRLDCERDTVFDNRHELLRCSMHGIVYQPETGESLSTMCEGERLKPLRLAEIDGEIHITDKRITPVS